MKALKHLFFTLIALIPLIYIAIIWKTIPDIIPTHFNGSMQPNHYGPKSSLWSICGILAGASLLVYFLVQNINKIDPKNTGRTPPKNYRSIAIVILVFMAILNMVIILFSTGSVTPSAKGKLLTPLLGLFIAVLGLMMRNIKPSYIVGVRLPWTLHSDYNWRKTHLVTGYVWLVCGLLTAVLSLCLPSSYNHVILRTFAGIIIIIPIAYSFVLFRKEQAHPEIADQDNNN